MEPAALLDAMQDILRQVLQDDEFEITLESTADDVDGWDSLAHIDIIVAAEREFGVRFATAEIASTKAAGQNVGTFLRLVASKMK